MNIINILLILILKIGQDILFLGKIDAYTRSNRLYYLIISFIEAGYGISITGYVLLLIKDSIWYVGIFGLGALIGAIISSYIKRKLDNKLEGQRKFFTRITLENNIDESDLINELSKNDFEFVVEKQVYISGKTRTVIQGSLEDRKRMLLLKNILRGRKGKHVVIMRAEDVYMIR